MLIETICNKPKIFIEIGIAAAITINIACFENIPEFLIEYLSKDIKPNYI